MNDKLSPVTIVGIILGISFAVLGIVSELPIFLWFGAISLSAGILIGERLEK